METALNHSGGERKARCAPSPIRECDKDLLRTLPHAGPRCLCPTATIANCLKFSGLKQHQLILSQSGSQTSNTGLRDSRQGWLPFPGSTRLGSWSTSSVSIDSHVVPVTRPPPPHLSL